MSAEEQQPSVLEQAARQAAEHAARELAKQSLGKVAVVLGAKGGALVAVVIAVIAIVVLVVVLIVSVAGAAFQSSTAVWPVPVATDTAGAYMASGWTISSRYGWRDRLNGGGAEFHDGIDLANPQGGCPFGYHCGAPAMFDGHITYVGWDQAASGDPSKTGGGELVVLRNGDDDHETLYAHLEPYRLYVRLEGRIKDSYDRDEYRRYEDYQTIGQGELKPDLTNGGIEMTCQNEMPNFIATRTGGGSVVFLYDQPARCTTTVIWGQRGGAWQGWIPDTPGHWWGDAQRADLHWQTPIEAGKRAKDVALRFRAHLVPPDPPPSPTALPTPGSVSASRPAVVAAHAAVVQPGWGSMTLRENDRAAPAATPSTGSRNGKPQACETLSAGWVRCTWALADIPSEQERFAQQPDPWLVAAKPVSISQTAPAHDEADAEGPAVPSAQLRPTVSASGVSVEEASAPMAPPPTPAAHTPLPTPTSLPAAPRTQGMQVVPLGRAG